MVTRQTKKKKPSTTTLNRKLDSLFTKLVCKRANNKCELCMAKKTIQTHHICGRRNMRLRWDIRNGICLCAKHHRFATDSVEQDGTTVYEYMVDYRPEDWDYLISVKYDIKKWDNFAREELLALFEKLNTKEEITDKDVNLVSSICGQNPFSEFQKPTFRKRLSVAC